jgi:hypothetical protein
MAQVWSAWVEWVSSNPQWPFALEQVGGQSLGGGIFIPPYFFLLNGWRIRPMESSHLLKLSGNVSVKDGGDPVVNTLGAYNVSVQYTVPVQAQAFNTEGGGGGTAPTAQDNANAVWSHPFVKQLLTVTKYLGLK